MQSADDYTFATPAIETAHWGRGFGYGSGFSSHTNDLAAEHESLAWEERPRFGGRMLGQERSHVRDGAGSQDFPVLAQEGSERDGLAPASNEVIHLGQGQLERYTLRVRAPTASGNIVQVFSTVRGFEAVGRISQRVGSLLREHGVSVTEGGGEVEKEEPHALDVSEEEGLARTLATRMLTMLEGAEREGEEQSPSEQEPVSRGRKIGREGRAGVGEGVAGRQASPHGAMYRLRREPTMLNRGRDTQG